MRKRGFTLAELLGVITLLGVIALIVIPIVDKTLKNGKEDLYKSQIKIIEASAKLWGTDHINLLPSENESNFITLATLQEDGYIEDEIENPKTGKPFNNNLQIKITSHGTYYTYEVVEENH